MSHTTQRQKVNEHCNSRAELKSLNTFKYLWFTLLTCIGGYWGFGIVLRHKHKTNLNLTKKNQLLEQTSYQINNKPIIFLYILYWNP